MTDEVAREDVGQDVANVDSRQAADRPEPEAATVADMPEPSVQATAEPAAEPPAVEQADDVFGSEDAAPAGHVGQPPRDPAADDAMPTAAMEAEPEMPVEAPPKLATSELKAILEALIFASPEPLTPKQMFKLLDTEPKEDVQAAIAELKQDYESPGGLQLVEVAGGYQIVTRPDLHEWVRRLFHERTTQKLSVQALETLAVIAYRQPVTALEIAEIRGVNTSGVLNTLLERHLIKIVGRKQVVGRPFMYATTKEFLIRFGLNDLNDLPKVEDMAEALGFETPAGLVEQNPPEDLLPLEEPDEEYAATPEEAEGEEEEKS